MKVIETDEGILLEEVDHFDATHIFECGQCFRWRREQDGSYTGVAFDKVLNVKSDYEKRQVLLKNTCMADFQHIWFKYFDLGRDYGAIQEALKKDPIMKEAIGYGPGIRILNQEPWEILISFILSSNSNIPKISKSIGILAQQYGKALLYQNESFFSFPTAEALVAAAFEDINLCRAGYRCRYIHETAQLIASKAFSLDSVKNFQLEEARKQLMTLHGVGPKVADCILLFSMEKHGAYPIDVWVKRVTEQYYLHRDASYKEILQFANSQFGALAGFAQQYLFYFVRNNS